MKKKMFHILCKSEIARKFCETAWPQFERYEDAYRFAEEHIKYGTPWMVEAVQ